MYFAPPDSEPNQLIRPINEAQHRLVEAMFRQAANHERIIKDPSPALAATLIGTINTYIGFAFIGYIEFSQKLPFHAVHQFLHGIYQNAKQEEIDDERFAG